MNQRGFIFDFDGVVADTTEAHYLAWARLCAENDWAFDRQLGDQLRGLTRRECLRLILGGTLDLPEATIQAHLNRKNEYFLERANQMTEADVLPGVLPLMEEMRSAGYKNRAGERKPQRPLHDTITRHRPLFGCHQRSTYHRQWQARP